MSYRPTNSYYDYEKLMSIYFSYIFDINMRKIENETPGSEAFWVEVGGDLFY